MCKQCPYCKKTNTKKNGTQNGKQRYLCKENDCRKSFQDGLIKIKKTYSAEKFFNTLYKLIESKDNNIRFDETSLDKINSYLKEKIEKKNIVINLIPKKSGENLVVHSYNLKMVIVFENNREVQIYKYDSKAYNKQTEKCKITIIDDNKKQN